MVLSKYIKTYENFLPLEIVSTFLKYSNQLKFDPAKVGKYAILNERIRKVKEYSLSTTTESLTDCHWANYLNFKITNYMNFFLHELNVLPSYLKIIDLNQLSVLKYEIDHHYDFHIDGSPEHNRTLSSILFLNNDYEGGNVIFKLNNEEKIIIKPSPGKLLIWPSNFMYPHSVQPITKGTRFSVVAWA